MDCKDCDKCKPEVSTYFTPDMAQRIYNNAMCTYYSLRSGMTAEKFALLRHMLLDLASLSLSIKAELENRDVDIISQKYINDVHSTLGWTTSNNKKSSHMDPKYYVIKKEFSDDTGKFTDNTD